MGILADAYKWIDANLAGGLLPGGHPVAEPGATIGGVIPTPFVGIQPAATPTAAAAPGAMQVFGGGAAAQAALGFPVTAPRMMMPRGRSIIAEASLMPDGTIMPRRMLPGRVVVTSADLKTVKRMKRAQGALNRAFPTHKRRRRSYTRTRVVTAKK